MSRYPLLFAVVVVCYHLLIWFCYSKLNLVQLYRENRPTQTMNEWIIRLHDFRNNNNNFSPSHYNHVVSYIMNYISYHVDLNQRNLLEIASIHQFVAINFSFSSLLLQFAASVCCKRVAIFSMEKSTLQSKCDKVKNIFSVSCCNLLLDATEFYGIKFMIKPHYHYHLLLLR